VASLYALEADQPVITQQPLEQTINVGSTATFTVAATANHPLTYQWFKDGTPISGATNTTLALTNVQSAAVGFYSVTVSNAVTGVASANALLNLTGYADPTWRGLVAYYPFNGNANDESGNGNGLVNFGCQFQGNRFGDPSAAGWFSGSDYLVSTNIFPLAGTMPRTVSLWCYRTNIEQGAMVVWGDAAKGYGQVSALYLESPGNFLVNGYYSDLKTSSTNMIVGLDHGYILPLPIPIVFPMPSSMLTASR